MEFQSFNTPEDMIIAIRNQQDYALRAYNKMPKELLDCLAPGNYYLILDEVLIFGEIIESEYEEDRENMKEQPYLRLVKAYSVACIDGEMGTSYINRMIPIPKAYFDFAKSKGWNIL